MVSGRAAASEDKRMVFAVKIARFGAILIIERGRSSRSHSARSFPIRVSASSSSQRGRVGSWPDPAGPDGRRRGAGGGRRENSGQGDGGAPTLTGCQDVSSPFRSQRGLWAGWG